MTSWKRLGNKAPDALDEARLQLHYAVQLLAIGVGRSLLPARDDDSHTALDWDAERGAWLSQPIPEADQLRAGLVASDLALTVGEATLPLAGKTLAEGLAWLREQLGNHGVDATSASLDSHYDMPHHAVGEGAAFDDPATIGCPELAAYYSNAHLLVSQRATRHDDASPVVTWPHHFDMATLRTLGRLGDDGCSIGIGFSPGDGYVHQPYFYVTPWPKPDGAGFPVLPFGAWRHDDFFGAVLTASNLVDEKEQEWAVKQYLATAIAASEHWLADCAPASEDSK